jgi:hypothetical protein
LDVAGIAVDRRYGDDHVEDLLKGEVVADLVSALRGGQQRPADGDHPGAVAAEYRVAGVRVLEQLGGDVAVAGDKGGEPVQPGREGRAGRLSADARAARDLGHRHLGLRIGERGRAAARILSRLRSASARLADEGSWFWGVGRSKWTGYPLVATVNRTCYPRANAAYPTRLPGASRGGRLELSMEYRPLGRTGISVSQLCLGAMMLGAFGNPDHDDAVKIIHRALDAGINFIDTADGYSAGESEVILGKALAGGRRDSVVLAVKFGVPLGEDPNHRGASRRWITEAVEGSLRRLQTDWIDLYQVDVPAGDTNIDETLGALTDLVRAGKVRSLGASKVPASEIVEA